MLPNVFPVSPERFDHLTEVEAVDGQGDGQWQFFWTGEHAEDDQFPEVCPAPFHHAQSPQGSKEGSDVLPL